MIMTIETPRLPLRHRPADQRVPGAGSHLHY